MTTALRLHRAARGRRGGAPPPAGWRAPLEGAAAGRAAEPQEEEMERPRAFQGVFPMRGRPAEGPTRQRREGVRWPTPERTRAPPVGGGGGLGGAQGGGPA